MQHAEGIVDRRIWKPSDTRSMDEFVKLHMGTRSIMNHKQTIKLCREIYMYMYVVSLTTV